MSDVAVAAKPVDFRTGVSITDTFIKPVRQYVAWLETVDALRGVNAHNLRDIGVEADIETFAWERTSRF
ncbi:MAG: hypothetical protein AAFU68_06220 [Pseudomonadota bacterium]